MGDEPLFKGTIEDQFRAILRTDFGYSEEELAAVKDGALGTTIYELKRKETLHREHLAELPRWVAAGYISKEEGAAMRRWELRDLAAKVFYLEAYRADAGKQSTEPPSLKELQPPPTPPSLSRNEVLALVAKTIAVVAAQQVMIDELRAQVATLHNLHVAVFGQQKVIEQLTSVARDFEGVEVTMRLEEQSTTTAESSLDTSEESAGRLETAGTMSAAIEGLASLVAGLSVGRGVDLTEMNRATKQLSERSKQQAHVRSKGEVQLKFEKITGGRRDE